jgi:hypothetical protein
MKPTRWKEYLNFLGKYYFNDQGLHPAVKEE